MVKRRASRIPRPASNTMTGDERRRWIEGLTPQQREQFEQRIRQMAGEAAQQELIQVLAHADFLFFRKHWAAKTYALDESGFTAIQEQLRQVWNPDVATEVKNQVLTEWLQADKNTMAVADWERGQMWVNPASLTAEIASIMLRNKNRLAVCQNPDCNNPYFIAPKKGRKYCEQGGCTIYAQRKYARESWQRKHGKGVTNGGEETHGTRKTR
jgi:hypothetical protein